jgi:integrase-like protein
MLFGLNTGMRQREILNLQWQDVDFSRGTLIVMKSKNGKRAEHSAEHVGVRSPGCETVRFRDCTRAGLQEAIGESPSSEVSGAGVLRGSQSGRHWHTSASMIRGMP